MAGRVYIDFVETKLTSQLLAAGLTANITTGDGALFAGVNFAGGEYLIATLRHKSGGEDAYRELVKITNRATDALTIVRAQDGTAAAQFEVDDVLDIAVTASSFTPFSGMTTGFVDAETPSGSVNSSNTAFTLAHTPAPAASLILFLDNLFLIQSVDYTISSAAITMTNAPQTGQRLRAFYRY